MDKKIILALLLAFGIKALVLGLDTQTTACISILAISSFLYEKFLQAKEVYEMKKISDKQQLAIELLQKEMQETKAYVTSQKLNGMRQPNGFNRTAQ